MKKVLIVIGVLVLAGMILVGVVWWYSPDFVIVSPKSPRQRV